MQFNIDDLRNCTTGRGAVITVCSRVNSLYFSGIQHYNIAIVSDHIVDLSPPAITEIFFQYFIKLQSKLQINTYSDMLVCPDEPKAHGFGREQGAGGAVKML